MDGWKHALTLNAQTLHLAALQLLLVAAPSYLFYLLPIMNTDTFFSLFACSCLHAALMTLAFSAD